MHRAGVAMTPFRVAHKVPALFFLPRFFAAFSLASYLPRLARVWCLCVCSVSTRPKERERVEQTNEDAHIHTHVPHHTRAPQQLRSLCHIVLCSCAQALGPRDPKPSNPVRSRDRPPGTTSHARTHSSPSCTYCGHVRALSVFLFVLCLLFFRAVVELRINSIIMFGCDSVCYVCMCCLAPPTRACVVCVAYVVCV